MRPSRLGNEPGGVLFHTSLSLDFAPWADEYAQMTWNWLQIASKVPFHNPKVLVSDDDFYR